ANRCRSRDAVLWIKRAESAPSLPDEAPKEKRLAESDQHKIIAYLEGDVQIEAGRREERFQQPRNSAGDRGWLGRFRSHAIEFRMPRPGLKPPLKPTVYLNGVARRNPDSTAIQRTQFTVPNAPAPAIGAPAAGVPPAAAPAVGAPGAVAPAIGTRRLQFFPRSGGPQPQARWIPNQARDEGVLTITGGVQIFIEGLAGPGALDIAADNVVMWTAGTLSGDLQEKFQDDNVPLEVYLEGNVVFRQGDRVIYANRMFYDVNRRNGTIVDTEIFTPAASYGGM